MLTYNRQQALDVIENALASSKPLQSLTAIYVEWKRWSAVHYASPGKDRAKERSRFFPGIAAAMAAQWVPFIQSQGR